MGVRHESDGHDHCEFEVSATASHGASDIEFKILSFVRLSQEWGDVPIANPRVANKLGNVISALGEELSSSDVARAELEGIAVSHLNTAVRIKAATASLRWRSTVGENVLAEISVDTSTSAGMLPLFAEAVLGSYHDGLLFRT
jgi:hypothetical protein